MKSNENGIKLIKHKADLLDKKKAILEIISLLKKTMLYEINLKYEFSPNT
jgi:hypothetical protein